MFSPYDEPEAGTPVAVVVGDDPELTEPETGGDESMEEVYGDVEDTAPAVPQVKAAPQKPAAKRRQGVSRLFAEAVIRNPGLTQSEYQRALGIKSPIATMAKRLEEKGIIMAKHDGRFVRYFPGNTPYTEVSRGRKPGASAKPKSRKTDAPAPKVKAEPKKNDGFDSIDCMATVEGPYGMRERYVRIAGEWYELIESAGPAGI